MHHVSSIRDGWWLDSPSILTSMFTSAFSLLKAHSEIVKAFVGTFNKESPNIVNIKVHECHNWLMATLRQYRELSPVRAGVPWPGVPSVPQQVILSYITRPCQPCHRSHSSAAQHLPTHSITVLQSYLSSSQGVAGSSELTIKCTFNCRTIKFMCYLRTVHCKWAIFCIWRFPGGSGPTFPACIVTPCLVLCVGWRVVQSSSPHPLLHTWAAAACDHSKQCCSRLETWRIHWREHRRSPLPAFSWGTIHYFLLSRSDIFLFQVTIQSGPLLRKSGSDASVSC